jgi:LysR family transcriptional regulator, glycine cleavage system transcriptional activator
MIRHRPAQRSLEAFVAAARFLSFTRAASALHLTVPAVSRRIQAIETEFGVQLFHRGPRALSLTPVGKRSFDELAPALLAVEEAHDVLRRALPSTVVTVSVPTLFGANWLLPRLKDFFGRPWRQSHRSEGVRRRRPN